MDSCECQPASETRCLCSPQPPPAPASSTIHPGPEICERTPIRSRSSGRSLKPEPKRKSPISPFRPVPWESFPVPCRRRRGEGFEMRQGARRSKRIQKYRLWRKRKMGIEIIERQIERREINTIVGNHLGRISHARRTATVGEFFCSSFAYPGTADQELGQGGAVGGGKRLQLEKVDPRQERCFRAKPKKPYNFRRADPCGIAPCFHEAEVCFVSSPTHSNDWIES